MRDVKSRFHEWCRWLQWAAWEFGCGIDIDQDGGIAGSGFVLRIEPPRWLRSWARRYIPPPTEEEMRFARQGISDVVLGSLLAAPMTGLISLKISDAPFLAVTTWTEDGLS